MKILGISAFFHDSAAALVVDGVIVAAVQEERLTRIKGDDRFPLASIKWILTSQNLLISDVDAIVFYEKPFKKFERILGDIYARSPRSLADFHAAMPLWLGKKLFLPVVITKLLKKHYPGYKIPPIKFGNHHSSHAASAFFPSPFSDAVIVVCDGVGERDTTSIYHGSGSKIEKIQSIEYPHSLGLAYSLITKYLGFKPNSGEYKVMGLAPYGSPIFLDTLRQHVIFPCPDGSFKVSERIIDLGWSSPRLLLYLEEKLGRSSRRPELDEITQFHKDVAASFQRLCEEIFVGIISMAAELNLSSNLCLAGGVALNCVAAGIIQRSKLFDEVWVQPAAGDAGASLGAALEYAASKGQKFNKGTDVAGHMKNCLLGPAFGQKEIEKALRTFDLKFEVLDEIDLVKTAAEMLFEGLAIGWFQGQMEFGPRALGARSIIASPLLANMQRDLNLKIKFRESFRPFAPIVREESASRWFQITPPSPFMSFVVHRNISKTLMRSTKDQVLPAVTHIDGTSRVQTVNKNALPRLHKLLSAFGELSGVDVLVNTSFNVRGEPIVCTPSEAINCFLKTDLDALVIGNCLVVKSGEEKISSAARQLYLSSFSPD